MDVSNTGPARIRGSEHYKQQTTAKALPGAGRTGFLSVQHKAHLGFCPETQSRAAHIES